MAIFVPVKIAPLVKFGAVPLYKPSTPSFLSINPTSWTNEWFPLSDYNLTLSRSHGLATKAPVEPDNTPAANFVNKDVFFSFDIIFLKGSYNPNLNVEYVASRVNDALNPLYKAFNPSSWYIIFVALKIFLYLDWDEPSPSF